MSIDTRLAHTIVEIVKDQRGHITGYKLENGEQISTEEAFTLARQGVIKGIKDITSKKTQDTVSLPDGDGNNNLGELPIIK